MDEGRIAPLVAAMDTARSSDQEAAWVQWWRACALLAYSLRKDAVDRLRTLLQHPGARTREDAAAAIDAIQSRNHHRYVDRDHSGRTRWVVNEGDDRQ